jgi:hypothetical protein
MSWIARQNEVGDAQRGRSVQQITSRLRVRYIKRLAVRLNADAGDG